MAISGIKVINMAEVRRDLKELGGIAIVSSVIAGVWGALKFLLAKVRENIKRQGLVDTGDLLNGWRLGVAPIKRTRIEGTLESSPDVPHALIHEFGGPITPKRGGFLRFFSDWDGAAHTGTKDIFWQIKKAVMPARPYARPAMDNNQQGIDNAFAVATKVAINAYYQAHNKSKRV